MKKFIAVLAGLMITPAFSEVAPVYYDEFTEYSDEFAEPEPVSEPVAAAPTAMVAPTVNPARNAAARNTAVRAAPAVNTTTTRGTATRAVANRAPATTPVRTGAVAQRAPVRAATTSAIGTSTARRTTPVANTARSAAPANTVRAASAPAGLVQTDTVNSPLYTSRGVSVRPTSGEVRPTSAAATAATSRISTASVARSATAVASATSVANIDELVQLTETCKSQYTLCMDNFCNTLDDNQGRCSCSANLKNYAESETALKNATAALQDVAQQIQYIGLSADEVSTIFTQTEAELQMQNASDNSQIASDLDKIKDMIIGVQSGTAISTASNMGVDLSGLLDFSFDSAGFDLNSLLNTNTNNASISNQRGAELFKTAVARCKASVLDSCTASGVDTAIVTNSYDLEIDKQCMVYERNLNEANSQMEATVRNAKSVLQRARLVVAQQKNEYDLRGCVNALDTCMQDEFVCGSNYENCLDPTGKYIVNGNVVIGSEPGPAGATSAGLYETWDTAWDNKGDLNSFITSNYGKPDATSISNIVNFIENKIGYNEAGKNYGMCMSVLNKCQEQTYKNGEYQEKNNVVLGYLQRTLTQIKAAQDETLAEYAETCSSELASCLISNNGSSSYSYNNNNELSNTAKYACNSLAKTCASVIDTETDGSSLILSVWSNIQGKTCPSNSIASSVCTTSNSATSSGTAGTNGCPKIGCRCEDGFKSANGTCVKS